MFLGRMLAESIAELAPDFPTRSIAVIPVPLYRAKTSPARVSTMPN